MKRCDPVIRLYGSHNLKMGTIHPNAVVHENAQLADDVSVGPNCVVSAGARIGSGTTLMANVVIEPDVVIGTDNLFFPGSVMGATPQILGCGPDAETGRLVIGNRNTFREHVTVHRSMSPEGITLVGDENLLMIGAHVGHDCILEDKLVITNGVHMAGHCKLETGGWVSGLVGMHQFVTLGKWCYIAGHSTVGRDVPPYMTVAGNYPSKVRGINDRGVQRAGLGDARLKSLRKAQRQLYRKGGSLIENAKRMEEQEGLDPAVHEITDFIARSATHRFGRYLELFRQ